MPKGYFFVEVEIADPAAYEAYRTKVPDIISAQMASCRTAAGLLSNSKALRP